MENVAKEIMTKYANNTIIMDFVKKEALEKVATEINNRIKNGSATAKSVEILSYRHQNIADRVNQYVAIGLIAVASMEK